ncbi:MAG: rod shape-determining protein RodA [Clostridiales bacterium]|jgi:rod shape determining protein RodA|nr:rod shape-determining protein RodA [Clostridiales bacterium]
MFDKRLIKNLDFFLIFIVILLVGIGIFGIGAAKRLPSEGGDSLIDILKSFNLRHVKLQFFWLITGLFLMIIVISMDYNTIGDYAEVFYWTVIALLVIVEVAGVARGQAQRWIAIGPFSLQPPEFAKIACIIIGAKTLSKIEAEERKFKDFLPAIVRFVIPVIFVIQHDFGTSMVLIIILMGMLFVMGMSYKLIFGFLGAGAVAAPIMWFNFLTQEQKDRIRVFLNPGLDPNGDGYNVIQSVMAIGSGRITGKSLLSGNTLSQLNYLPEPHTDFIYSVIVEALGFVGGLAVIILYATIIIRSIQIAGKAKDTFGQLIVIGVVCMQMAHIFENIGMTMGIMPITGIPLPFLSYGGSFMWTNMIALGLVLNVGMRRQKIKF